MSSMEHVFIHRTHRTHRKIRDLVGKIKEYYKIGRNIN